MTLRKRIGTLPAAFPLAFISLGVALPDLASSAQTHPKILDQAVNAGVKVVRQFPAASGLTGWVLSQDGRHSIVYTTADKKTLLAGALIGENGQSLSDRYEEQFVPKPDLTAAYQQLEKASYVTEGATATPKRVIYIFVDPNCPYCHYTWRAVQPYQAAGLQVRWILVATLGPTSLPKSIEVLAAPDKTSAFRKMEANHGKPWAAAAKYGAAAHPAIAAAIERNGELMQAFGIAGTPGVVWRDQHGKVQVKSGMPRLSELPGITGLPLQKITDPELERFK
jgi:thiol:disulfide interchange protein DsbG